MTARRGEEVAVAAALGAALASYLLAYFPVTEPSLKWLPALLSVGLSAVSLAVRWERVPARLVRPTLLVLRIMLGLTGALLLFSRQFPLVRADLGRQGGAVVGGVLALLAMLFLSGRRAWRAEAGALPAIIGLLVAAGMEHTFRASFIPLACLSCAALWTYALVSGGPRRFGLPLAFSVAAAGGLVWAILWFLPVAQPHVQEFMARAYAEGRTGLSDRSELGEVESLAQSRRIVARVWTTSPQLLRMQVLTHFDGRRWAAGHQEPREVDALDQWPIGGWSPGPLLESIPSRLFAVDLPRTAGTSIETKILSALSFDDGWGVLTPASPVVLAWPGEKLTIDNLGRVAAEEGVARLYGVASGGGPARSETEAADLALPARLDPRVRRLAEALRSGARSNREVVARTVAHLRSGYRYTLDVGRFRSGDPLAEFLFEKKAGYCEYFASAAIVLLRLQGIPSRYVKGVAVRPESQVLGHYVVRESDAHAWVDAYLSGEGWVEQDPTPPDGYALTHADEPRGALSDRWEALQARWSEAWARFQQGTWPRLTASVARAARRVWNVVREQPVLIAAVLAISALLGAGLRLRRRRRRRPMVAAAAASAPVPADLNAALGKLEKHWRRRGRPRPASCGLREHLDGIPAGVLSPEERSTSLLVVESYYRASFGGRSPSSEELAGLRRSLRALR